MIWDPVLYLAHESFGNGARLPVFSPWRQSLDCALISLSRPLSEPDRKFSRGKRGGDKSRASRDAREVPLYQCETNLQEADRSKTKNEIRKKEGSVSSISQHESGMMHQSVANWGRSTYRRTLMAVPVFFQAKLPSSGTLGIPSG